MLDSDKEEFGRMMETFGAVYEKELKPGIPDIYFDLMKRHSMERVRKAARAHLKESQYFPKPADLLNRIVPDGYFDPLDREEPSK